MHGTGYRFRVAGDCIMCGAPPHRQLVLGRRLDRSQGWRPRRVRGKATTVVRCRGCGLVFTDPLPLPIELADHYSMDPVDYFGEERSSAESGGFETEIEEARELLGYRGRGRALDVGAGTGRVMAALSEAGFDTWGIEPSASFRSFGLEKYSLDPERIALAGIDEARFPSSHFDFISFGAVLEHLPAPGLAIEKALEWLRPDGVIHAEVPSSRWLVGRLLNAYFRLSGSGLVTNLSPMHPPYHLYEFTEESFRRHGERVGYRVEKVRRIVGDVYAPAAVAWPLARLMEATDTGMQLVVWLMPNR